MRTDAKISIAIIIGLTLGIHIDSVIPDINKLVQRFDKYDVFLKAGALGSIMKPIGEIEEELANKALPILGFKPSSKIKRGPIGILISIICIAIVYRELNSAGII